MIGLAAAAAALVYLLLQRLVFRRLQDMIGTMKDLSARLAGGDYDVGSAVCATGDDEVGRLEAFFGDFLRLVGRTLRDLSGRLKGVRRPG
jgi:methyl-accepting chemotaxis protein